MVITKKAVECEYQIKKIGQLLEKIWLKWNNYKLYIQAFIHKSIVNERQDYAPEHNERLEFLWDAVLELIITNKLYLDFPEKSEWDLTDIRSAIVRWSNLAKVANNLNFTDYLLLWKWEEKTWWRTNNYILANTVEAFLWAIYLDLGYEIAEKFTIKYIYSYLNEIIENKLTKDYKTLFQEYAQAKFEITPKYILLSDEWPDHDKIFKVWVYIWEKQIWEGNWSSKKKAQEMSAKDAYNNINK